MQRQYHCCNPWRLSESGLYSPHSYTEIQPDSLSWWDDVGFILNGRRVIVWWQHPRVLYSDAINDYSWQEAGDGPHDNWLTEGCTKNYKKVGASRKKIVGYTSRQPSVEQSQYYDKLTIIRQRLAAEGIDMEISLSCKFQYLTWAIGINLVAPLEVRNEHELAIVAALAKRLILQQTTLEEEFPSYSYNREDWLGEQKIT